MFILEKYQIPFSWVETFAVEVANSSQGVGYEINFNRFFYKYVTPRKLEDIDADLKQVAAEIAELLREIMG